MKMSGREKFRKYKKYLNIVYKLIKIFPWKIRFILYNAFKNKRGISGITIRYVLLKSLCKSCGDNVSIHPNVYLFNLDKISFGSNVSIHPMCYIDGQGEIEIGNDVSIAHGVSLLSFEHSYVDNELPIKYQNIIREKIRIKNDVWIGAKSTILSGRTLETGCIVGANSVVTKDVYAYSIVAGAPAHVIKKRR